MSRQTLDKKNEREKSIWKSQRNVSQAERKTNAKSPRQEFVWIFETTRNPVWQNESEKEEELKREGYKHRCGSDPYMLKECHMEFRF